MDTGADSLVGLYIAGLCGLGYGARQIVRAEQEKGIAVDTIVVSGGAGQSALVRQILADATGLTVVASSSPEPVLLGSAMLGAVASGDHADLRQAMEAMSSLGEIYAPRPDLSDWHGRRFAAFEALQQVGRTIRNGS
jgi:D-ribulokinase